MAAWVGVAAVVGVCVPLGLAVNPSALTTRVAFTCFIGSIVIVGWVTLNGARRATPEWLVRHVATRVLRLRGRRPRARRELAGRITVLGDLVGSPRLPVREHRLAAVAWAVGLTVQVRAGADVDDVAQAVREVGADLSRETTPDHRAAITAIAALGERTSRSLSISDAVMDVLFDLAVQNRAAGRHQVAAEALDAVVDAVSARLAEITPSQQVLTLVILPRSSADPRRAQATKAELPSRFSRRRTIVVPPTSSNRDQHVIERVNELTRQPVSVADLGQLLADLVPDRTTGQRLNRDAPTFGDQSYELLESTVDRMIGVLTSPTPTSIGWAGGHHEASGFSTDVERLGNLGLRLYAGHRYSRSDAIETHLETVAAKLIGTAAAPPTPRDRTRWRIAHLSRRPSPASMIAATLQDLAIGAFEAGYDRRALLTSRRLLSLATTSAIAGDHMSTRSYTEAIYRFINRTTYHTGSTAVAERGALIIAGLIRESDDLRRALPADEADPDDPVSLLRALPWQASGFEFVLAAAAWQSELRAVGWLRDARPRLPDPTADERLPSAIREEAFKELNLQLGGADPIYPAFLLLTLWADAVAARLRGDNQPASKLASYLGAYLADHLAELDDHHQGDWSEPDEPLPNDERENLDDVPGPQFDSPQLWRIANTITVWAQQPETKAAPVIPAAKEGARHLLSLLAEAARTPGFQDWTYHGVTDAEDSSVVVIRYPDGERILLRDEEAGGRGLFSWGYSGDGPHTLAEALARHAAGSLLRCTDCFGASSIARSLIVCAACANSGHRPGIANFTMLLVSRVISSLPREAHTPSAPSNVLWTLTRAELIRSTTGRDPRRTPRARRTPDDAPEPSPAP
ncbi:hypothetical protein [Micromonospora sp. NPDC005172]|uniref:hypothetical protein n=1 Tax=Micromonospora sp. NPDC005172 TaxID=3156867 RepID=UPI0033BF9F34